MRIGESMKLGLCEIKSDALSRAPLIFENHFLKSFWMLYELAQHLSPSDETFAPTIWARLTTSQYPLANRPISSLIYFPADISDLRRKSIIRRGLFPSAYAALWIEICKSGAEAVLQEYLAKALRDPGYLGHRLSILESFYKSWELVKDKSEDLKLWSDRLMEFIVTAFISHRTAYSLENFELRGKTFNEVLESCLVRPGFFAHNLIALASAHRLISQGWVDDVELLLGKIYQMTQFEYTDSEDNVEIKGREIVFTDDAFRTTLLEFLFQGPQDPHVITSAHTFQYLWKLNPSLKHRKLIMINLESLK